MENLYIHPASVVIDMVTDLLTPTATVTLFSDDTVTFSLVNGVRPTIVV